jgi:cell filamentation protein
MARRESEALLAATERLIHETRVDQRFTAADICRMHRLWLGRIYPWAGEYRQLNMGKGGFMFAAASQVARLMREFERGPLREFTPCQFDEAPAQAHALGVAIQAAMGRDYEPIASVFRTVIARTLRSQART